MCCAIVFPLLGSHLWTHFGGALWLQMDNQVIEFETGLANVSYTYARYFFFFNIIIQRQETPSA